MKHRKALVSEEELDKVRKASKRASETRQQTLHRQEQNQTHNYDKHKHLSSSLHRGFCTSVLFITCSKSATPILWFLHLPSGHYDKDNQQ